VLISAMLTPLLQAFCPQLAHSRPFMQEVSFISRDYLLNLDKQLINVADKYLLIPRKLSPG
jgi:hypothetical protein